MNVYFIGPFKFGEEEEHKFYLKENYDKEFV